MVPPVAHTVQIQGSIGADSWPTCLAVTTLVELLFLGSGQFTFICPFFWQLEHLTCCKLASADPVVRLLLVTLGNSPLALGFFPGFFYSVGLVNSLLAVVCDCFLLLGSATALNSFCDSSCTEPSVISLTSCCNSTGTLFHKIDSNISSRNFWGAIRW